MPPLPNFDEAFTLGWMAGRRKGEKPMREALTLTTAAYGMGAESAARALMSAGVPQQQDATDQVCIIAGCGQPQASGSSLCAADAYDPYTGALLWPRGEGLDVVLRKRFNAGYAAALADGEQSAVRGNDAAPPDPSPATPSPVATVMCWLAAGGQPGATASVCGCVRRCALDGSHTNRFAATAPEAAPATGLHQPHGLPFPVYDACDMSGDDTLLERPPATSHDGKQINITYLCVAPDCLYRQKPGYLYCPAHMPDAAETGAADPCPVAYCGYIPSGATHSESLALLTQHQKDVHCDHAGIYDPDCDCPQSCCADGACPDDDTDQQPPLSGDEPMRTLPEDTIRQLRDMPFEQLPAKVRQWLETVGAADLYEQGPILPSALSATRQSTCRRAGCDAVVTTATRECPKCGLGWPFDLPLPHPPTSHPVVASHPELECNGDCSMCGANHYPPDTILPVSPFCYNCGAVGHYETDCEGNASDRTNDELLSVVINARKTMAHFTRLLQARYEAVAEGSPPARREYGMTMIP